MKRTRKRTGLKAYEVITIDAASPAGVVDRLLFGAAPSARLKRVKQRALAYPDVQDVTDEIQWIEEFIARPGFEVAIDFALLAIERGLDLLDTGKFIRAVDLGQRSSSSHATAASAPRKLTDTQRKRIAANYVRRVAAQEKYGAVKALAAEFDVSTVTINQVLIDEGAKKKHK